MLRSLQDEPLATVAVTKGTGGGHSRSGVSPNVMTCSGILFLILTVNPSGFSRSSFESEPARAMLVWPLARVAFWTRQTVELYCKSRLRWGLMTRETHRW